MAALRLPGVARLSRRDLIIRFVAILVVASFLLGAFSLLFTA